MKQLILIVTLALSINAYAQDDKTVTLVASGQGKTQDEAKQVALRSAIEQAFGAFISSKTEILNDNLVKDEIVSVTNGNIQKYDVLSEVQIPDGGYATTLKAVVSVAKLTSFCESKGVTVEIKGGLFALNIKQQILNEQGEIESIYQMIGVLHEAMQKSFDYQIKSSEPNSLDSDNKNWEIPISVTSKANNNMEWCGDYCLKTLLAISLSSEEVENYKTLNKDVKLINITSKGFTKSVYLRKEISFNLINTFASQFYFYCRNFMVLSGIEECKPTSESEIFESYRLSSRIVFTDYNQYKFDNMSGIVTRNYNTGKSELASAPPTSLNFLDSGQVAGVFSWRDKRTLEQIEKLTGYTVTSLGVRSQFKNGGIVIYENNGKGLVALFADIGQMNWDEAYSASNYLNLGGYDDWRLPKKEDFRLIYDSLFLKTLGNFHLLSPYWSLTNDGNSSAWTENFRLGKLGVEGKGYKFWVRPIRTFGNIVKNNDLEESPEWLNWFNDNMKKGCDVNVLIKTLVENGFSEESIKGAEKEYNINKNRGKKQGAEKQ